MERGEALDEFVRRHKPDFPTILQILGHVAERMQQLHREGFVHRDLKPANILWRPRAHSWTLIDFGCASRIGMPCPACCIIPLLLMPTKVCFSRAASLK
jgi:serine/threonine protein kinase